MSISGAAWTSRVFWAERYVRVSCGLYMSHIRLRINVGLSYVLSKRATQRDTPSNKPEVNSEFLGLLEELQVTAWNRHETKNVIREVNQGTSENTMKASLDTKSWLFSSAKLRDMKPAYNSTYVTKAFSILPPRISSLFLLLEGSGSENGEGEFQCGKMEKLLSCSSLYTAGFQHQAVPS